MALSRRAGGGSCEAGGACHARGFSRASTVAEKPSMALSNPILERIFSGEVPPAGRLSAAKGLLPLSREELLELAVRLRQDPDEAVRMAAQDTLFEFKPEELSAMGAGEDFHPDTFAFIWRS